jgi:cytochrome b561
MIRRPMVVWLHWTFVLLLLPQVTGGEAAPLMRWSFVAAGTLWLAVMAAGGPLARPGPKLAGPLRAAFGPSHWALYALVAAAVGLNAAALLGRAADGSAWVALLVLLCAGAFHAILHLWRHTTLNDGALRRITPRALERYL